MRFKQELRGTAAIVGPHGSGKSTLLTQIVPLLGELRWRQFEPFGPLLAIGNCPTNLATNSSAADVLESNSSAAIAGRDPVSRSETRLCGGPVSRSETRQCGGPVSRSETRQCGGPVSRSETRLCSETRLWGENNSPAAASTGRGVVWLVLRRRQRFGRQTLMAQILRSRSYWCPRGLLVLDGMEQLRSWEYLALRMLLTQAQIGLLATCHRPYWTLPCLCNTTPQPQILQRLIADRLAECAAVPPELRRQLTDLQLIQRMLKEEQGSVREVFMRLYDVVENQRLTGPITSVPDDGY